MGQKDLPFFSILSAQPHRDGLFPSYLGPVDIESIGDAIHGVQDGGGDAIRFKERVNGRGSMGEGQWERVNGRGSKTFYLEKWETEGVRGMIREDLSGQ